jgi:ketosteroid isomerase-like protein
MTTNTATDPGVDVVRAVFETFADADAAALGELLHADATWNHRNHDRLGGVHRGSDGIMAFLAQSARGAIESVVVINTERLADAVLLHEDERVLGCRQAGAHDDREQPRMR